MITIRLATPADAAPILAIYTPIVRETVISFELDPPTLAEMEQWISQTLQYWPWLTAEDSSGLVGYAYASQHRTRAAYQWSVDVSAYVRPDQHRQGIGRALYSRLLRLLPLQGYYNAYAGIALPNPASVRLHEAMGFRPVGVYQQVGYKLGAWHDVGWWQLSLQQHNPPVGPPIPLAVAQETVEWQQVISSDQSSSNQ
jgi:L-amino acid N-acyltransferase YncA